MIVKLALSALVLLMLLTVHSLGTQESSEPGCIVESEAEEESVLCELPFKALQHQVRPQKVQLLRRPQKDLKSAPAPKTPLPPPLKGQVLALDT